MSSPTDYEYLDEAKDEIFHGFCTDSDKENRPRATIPISVIRKRKRGTSETITTTDLDSGSSTQMDDLDMESVGVKRFRHAAYSTPLPRGLVASASMPEMVCSKCSDPLMSSMGKRVSSTPRRLTGTILKLRSPLPFMHFDDSSVTDSVATDVSSHVLLNSDSGIAMEVMVSAGTEDVITETPKMKKKIVRKQVLSAKVDAINAETTDDERPKSDEEEEEVVPNTKTPEAPKRRRVRPKRQKSSPEEVATSSTAERGRPRTRSVAAEATNPKPKRAKVAHICPTCNVEVATATILRYHTRKCGKTPEKPKK